MINTQRFPHPRPLRIDRYAVVRKLASRELKLTLLISFAHLPLGVLLYNIGSLAILHPVAVFLVGLYWALKKQFSIERVALAVAYIIGAEVLWRMAYIPIPWEFGKFASIALITISLLNRRLYRVPRLSLIYFVALLPSCLLTLWEFGLSGSREVLSSIMSGPLLLLFACWFFSNMYISPAELRRLLTAIIVPLISVGAVTLFYTVTLSDIRFSVESNFLTSGGFGPNQVSAMLGLGVFVALCCLVIFTNRVELKFYFGMATIFFTAQSVMTFSRGGIYNAIGGFLALSLFQARNLSQGVKRIFPILVLATTFYLFIFPLLNNFTGGKLQERFEETGTTNRAEIIWSDVDIFLANPLFGVGVGISNEYREQYIGFSAMSHTEFSRMIAEHGAFGLIAILTLTAMSVTNLVRQRSTQGRALIAATAVWTALFMSNAGMRLAAPSFMWGLTFITISMPQSRRDKNRIAVV